MSSVRAMQFNVTFNNISATGILWQSVLLVEEKEKKRKEFPYLPMGQIWAN
jgi:hypothetical protein